MSLSNLSSSNSNGAFLDYGEFRSGVYIQTQNQILYFTDNNGNRIGYQWKGSLPHITQTNDPSTDGGISNNTWMSVVNPGFFEKISNEGINLNWQAHLPSIEVSFNLPHKSLKIWKAGLSSTANDYWLYPNTGTVWSGVGVLDTEPTSPFAQIVPQNNIIEWSTIAVEGQNQFTVPYIFTNISLFINGLLQNKSTGGYFVNGSTVTLNGSLKANDVIHVLITNVPVSNLDYLTRSDLSDSGTSDLIGMTKGGRLSNYITFVTPQSQGSPCDGINDDTTYFKNMIQQYRSIYVPDGNYVLDINQLNVPSNTQIEFSQNAIIKLKTQKVAGGSGIQNWIFKIQGTSGSITNNISIIGGRFLGGDDSIVCVGVGSYVSDFSMKDVYCENIRGFIAIDGNGQYASSTKATRPKNIKLFNLKGNNSVQPVTTNGFIQFNYAEMFTVDTCYSTGYWFGAMCWGGNSDFNANGAIGNERKCSTGRFVNCYASVYEAGFWASMALDVDFESCYAETLTSTSDVGFDFEGSYQCNVNSCTAKDFLNGNFATFYYCKEVSFNNNKSIINNETFRHVRLNNAGQNSSSREIIFNNNTFETNGFISAITQNGSSDNVVFDGNIFINTMVSLIANNNGVISVTNNKFRYSIPPTQTFNSYGYYAALAIGAYHGFNNGECGAYVINNTFSTSVPWDANMSTPILLLHTSTTRSTYAEITGGGVLTTGWKYDFVVLNTSTNNTYIPRYTVDGYRVNSNLYATVPNATNSYPQGLVNARDAFGRPWPTAPVDGAFMINGQTFPSLTPTATKRGTYVYVAGVGTAAQVADYQ